MVAFLQVFFSLLIIILIILFVFQPRRKPAFVLPENFEEVLNDYVLFYSRLNEEGKNRFEEMLSKFLSSVKITGANAEVEDIDRLLIGAAAIIPIYNIPDWEYINLREVLVYPGNFNTEFEQQGHERMISGMVGTGALQTS